MTRSPVTLKWWMLALVIWFMVTGYPAPALAQSSGCFWGFKVCYEQALKMRYWDERLLASLDCELDFIDCTRRKLIGR